MLDGFNEEELTLLVESKKDPTGVAPKLDALGVRVWQQVEKYPGSDELRRMHKRITGVLGEPTKAQTKEEPEVKASQVAPPPQSAWRNFWRDHWGKVALGLLLLIALGVGSFKFGPKLMSWWKSNSQPVANADGFKRIPIPADLNTNSSTSASSAGGTVLPLTITPNPVAPLTAGPSVTVSGISGSSNVITVNQTIINQTTAPGTITAVQPPKGWPEVCTLETVDLDPRLHHRKQFSLAPGKSQKFRIPKGWNVKTFSMTHQELYSLWEGGMMNRPDISEEIDSSCVSLFNNKLQVELRFWFEFESRDLSR